MKTGSILYLDGMEVENLNANQDNPRKGKLVYQKLFATLNRNFKFIQKSSNLKRERRENIRPRLVRENFQLYPKFRI